MFFSVNICMQIGIILTRVRYHCKSVGVTVFLLANLHIHVSTSIPYHFSFVTSMAQVYVTISVLLLTNILELIPVLKNNIVGIKVFIFASLTFSPLLRCDFYIIRWAYFNVGVLHAWWPPLHSGSGSSLLPDSCLVSWWHHFFCFCQCELEL
jgi:hypothetical protein